MQILTHPEYKISIYMINVFRNALTRWSQTTKVLNFKETTSYNNADIKIGFYNINYDDEVNDVVVGDTFISLQLGSNVKSGLLRLDAKILGFADRCLRLVMGVTTI
jgi:hypothetical protein